MLEKGFSPAKELELQMDPFEQYLDLLSQPPLFMLS